MSNFVTTCGKAASILALASCAQDSRLSTQSMSRGEQTPNREGPPQLRALQPDVSSVAHTHHETGLSILSSDISSNTTLRIGRTYLIDGEVHVLRGVRLTIEDGVTVLIRNGYRARRTLDTSALIFDSGSLNPCSGATFLFRRVPLTVSETLKRTITDSLDRLVSSPARGRKPNITSKPSNPSDPSPPQARGASFF